MITLGEKKKKTKTGQGPTRVAWTGEKRGIES